MLRFIGLQVWHKRRRSLVLAVGVLVAATGFTLLTSQSSTSALQVRGAIAKNWRPAYDILVRPHDSYTLLERDQGLVRANHLSGIFGGITLRQWDTVLRIPGVAVAAPIENIGYILPFQRAVISISGSLNSAPDQLYRITQLRVANGGLSQYPGADLYVYYTKAHRFVDRAGDPAEIVPGRHDPIRVCNGYNYGSQLAVKSPFDLRSQSYLRCFSELSPELAQKENGKPFGATVGTVSTVYLPLLLSAIDPEQEGKLVGLDGAVVSGRSLHENDVPLYAAAWVQGSRVQEIPVLASTKTYFDERLRIDILRLQVPAAVDLPKRLASPEARGFLNDLPGRLVGTEDLSLQTIYQQMLAAAEGPAGLSTFESYRTVAPVEYHQLGPNRLAAIETRNPLSVWTSPFLATYLTAPVENADVQFRAETTHTANSAIVGGIDMKPRLRLVGRFDPALLQASSALSSVPLETYFPPRVEAADVASMRALGDRPLLPTLNMGGYVAQPPMLLTTLRAAQLFLDPKRFEGANPVSPISVIRVRIVGVEGPDSVSRERVRRVAEAIHAQTGLAVDITAGSSTTPMVVQLPAGKHGQPPLLVREPWVKKGVALVILRSLDRKSLFVFVLVLVVAALFVLNASVASVRGRRVEIGTLLAIGWTRSVIFKAVLGETAFLGLLAGSAGTAVGYGLAQLIGVTTPVILAILVTPVAALLATVAGIVPAWFACRGTPMDSVRLPNADRHWSKTTRSITQLAISNLRRAAPRTAIAALTVAAGVGASALLLSVNIAFQGTLVGTVLGQLVSIRVRPADYVAATLVMALAAGAVADVLFLSMKDRAREIAALHAVGWRSRDLRQLVLTEGVFVGILGSVPGTAAAAVLTGFVGGQLTTLFAVGAIVAAGGTLLVAVASLVPAGRAVRLSPSAILAEE